MLQYRILSYHHFHVFGLLKRAIKLLPADRVEHSLNIVYAGGTLLGQSHPVRGFALRTFPFTSKRVIRICGQRFKF
jgi:hypothetical protein